MFGFNKKKEKISGKDLADIVIFKANAYIAQHIDSFYESLVVKIGFSPNHLYDKATISRLTLLFFMALDTKSLFNLIDKNKADEIYSYVTESYFDFASDPKEKNFYYSEMKHYSDLFDLATNNNEPFFDNIFSKYISSITNEMFDNNVNPIQMIQIIESTMPLVAGKWKTSLENYDII